MAGPGPRASDRHRAAVARRPARRTLIAEVSEAPAAALYLDTSAVLCAVLESGTTPEVESRLRAAPALVTSRLSFVESGRAILRLRLLGTVPAPRLADAERELDALWARCEVWEITPGICEVARSVVPGKMLRTLDALHLATYLSARRRIEGLELLTADECVRDGASVV